MNPNPPEGQHPLDPLDPLVRRFIYGIIGLALGLLVAEGITNVGDGIGGKDLFLAFFGAFEGGIGTAALFGLAKLGGKV